MKEEDIKELEDTLNEIAELHEQAVNSLEHINHLIFRFDSKLTELRGGKKIKECEKKEINKQEVCFKCKKTFKRNNGWKNLKNNLFECNKCFDKFLEWIK